MSTSYHQFTGQMYPPKSETELRAMAYLVVRDLICKHFAPTGVEVDTYLGLHQCKVKIDGVWHWITVQDVLDGKWEFKPL